MSLISRILQAYKKSNKHLHLSIWNAGPYEQAEFVKKLVDVGQLENALQQFGSHPITDGMDASYTTYFPDLLERHTQEHRKLYRELTGWSEDKILFPTGYNITGIKASDETMIPVTAFRLGYYAHNLLGLQLPRKPVILEIGGGWGALAHIILNNYPAHYIIVDIPSTLTTSSYFLGSTGKNICLHGEYKDVWDAVINHDCTLIPHFAIEQIPRQSCDIVLNTASFIEMPRDVIKFYIKQVNRVCRDYFYNDNSATRWSGGTLAGYIGTMDDFDTIYKRETPINATLPPLRPRPKRRLAFYEQLMVRRRQSPSKAYQQPSENRR